MRKFTMFINAVWVLLLIDPINMHIFLLFFHAFLVVLPAKICSKIKSLKTFHFGDHFIHSYDLYVWSGSVIVGRIWMWVTLELKGLSCDGPGTKVFMIMTYCSTSVASIKNLLVLKQWKGSPCQVIIFQEGLRA